MVKDFSTNKWKVNKKEHLDSQDYGFSKTDFRHLTVLDLLDKNGIKTLNSLKDELGLTKLNYISHSLSKQIQLMKSRYTDLELG